MGMYRAVCRPVLLLVRATGQTNTRPKHSVTEFGTKGVEAIMRHEEAIAPLVLCKLES